MTKTLNEIGVNTEGLLAPVTNVDCLLQSGAQMRFGTPLSPEDVMTLWNSKSKAMKIPAEGEHAYAVIKKRNVDCLRVSLLTK